MGGWGGVQGVSSMRDGISFHCMAGKDVPVALMMDMSAVATTSPGAGGFEEESFSQI